MGTHTILQPQIAVNNQQMRRTLLAIQSATETMKSFTYSKLPKETTTLAVPNTCADTHIPALDLPFLSDLDATIGTLGLCGSAYLEARRKVQEWVYNLQTTHSFHFRRACHALASLPHFQNHSSLGPTIEQLRLTYQNKYNDSLPLITQQILSAGSNQNPMCKNAKIPFNNVSISQTLLSRHPLNPKCQEYTPLLELYFEQNAYPSAPDRKLLARKSMMTMRQIEVWVSFPFPKWAS